MWRESSADRGALTLPHLIERAKTGEPSAIADLYGRYATTLYQTAYRIIGSRSDAEDVVHDLFVGLPSALKRYEDHGQFAAWLKRVAVRLALVSLRSGRRRSPTASRLTAYAPAHRRLAVPCSDTRSTPSTGSYPRTTSPCSNEHSVPREFLGTNVVFLHLEVDQELAHGLDHAFGTGQVKDRCLQIRDVLLDHFCGDPSALALPVVRR